LTPYPPKGGLLNSIIFRCSPLGLGVKQMKIIEFTTFSGKLFFNVCSSCKTAMWAIFTVVHLSAEKPITKTYLNKACAFVKSIWLPMSSNYLIYSGESPGRRILPVNGYLNKQSKINDNILKINTYQQLKTIVL
jgi:hypothetical protein